MRNTASDLTSLINEFSRKLKDYRPKAQEHKTLSWTSKEILGHLIDSASNNHQRFVRMQISGLLYFPDYQQENRMWIRKQNYESRDWDELVTLWTCLNTHLAHIMASADDDAARSRWFQLDGKRITMRRLAEDYVAHARHHLERIMDLEQSQARRLALA